MSNPEVLPEASGGVSLANNSQMNEPGSALRTASHNATHSDIEDWVEAEYRRHSENTSGNLISIPGLGSLQTKLEKKHPEHSALIYKTLARIEQRLASKPLPTIDVANLSALANVECGKYTWTNENRSQVRESIISTLMLMRPDVYRSRIREIVEMTEPKATATSTRTNLVSTGSSSATSQRAVVMQGDLTSTSRQDPNPEIDVTAWALTQYVNEGFGPIGFLGYKAFKLRLQNLTTGQPTRASQAISTIDKLRTESNRQRFGIADQYAYIRTHGAARLLQKLQGIIEYSLQSPIQNSTPTPIVIVEQSPGPSQASSSTNVEHIAAASTSAPGSAPADVVSHRDSPEAQNQSSTSDLLSRRLNQFSGPSIIVAEDDGWSEFGTNSSYHSESSMDMLLSDVSSDEEDMRNFRAANDEIKHAPLFTSGINSDQIRSLIPQYGLLGSREGEKLFLNTNAPFSAFICGVQGSGKSHTTSCILENALVSSRALGRLENPLSALVFSYGQFGGDGSGFSISEAAFLAAPHRDFPGGNHVKKIQVLVSPSNFRKLSRLYMRVPNVSVSPFKLKPQNLDIDIMLTLMNVSESDSQPLYMAAVTQILRKMATVGGDFSYLDFKARLRKCSFNPAQISMLQLRMDLLESFLDLDGSCTEPNFNEGEVTIMDMSCPFVDASTACILFKIGLQRYLQSEVAGKMVVLDEAHKYMMPNPGSVALTETLRTTVRLQRHYGARLVISTQEPTLLTDLIALCSVTVIHRFSSPEWFAAIRRHIPMRPEECQATMAAIENLRTGTALVYSPSAVLGEDENGRIIKGTGKMLKVYIRKRITSDGGQSILAT